MGRAAVDRHDRRALKAQRARTSWQPCAALERVLISDSTRDPIKFHLPEQWLARWTRIARPARDIALWVPSGNLVERATTLRLEP